MRAFRDDPDGQARVGAVTTTAALVHLRRPSNRRRSTCPTRSRSTTRPGASRSATTATCATTGPCVDVPGTGSHPRAGGHGGRRAGSRTRGSMASRWATCSVPCMTDSGPGQPLRPDRRWGAIALRRQRREPGVHVSPRPDRPASTGIYSLDRSLFKFVALGATERRPVGQRPRSPSTATERHTPTSRLRAGARSHGTRAREMTASPNDTAAQPAFVDGRPTDASRCASWCACRSTGSACRRSSPA